MYKAKVKDGTFFLYMLQITPKMRPKTAARLMYLATYLSYDGVLRSTQRTKMTKKRMAELLGLKRKTFDRFFSEVTDAGMLIKTDDGYTMNHDYFVRGKVERADNTRFTRVFIKSMRALYEATPPRLQIGRASCRERV